MQNTVFCGSFFMDMPKVCFTLSCFVGLALSIYAFVIGQAIENDVNFKASCDINEEISCTKVFKTEYAKGFGIFKEGSPLYKPNSLVGMIFYSMLIVSAQIKWKPFALLTFLASAGSVLLSIYLAYLLAFVIRSLCIICLGTYLVNFANLICSYRLLKNRESSKPKPQIKKKRV